MPDLHKKWTQTEIAMIMDKPPGIIGLSDKVLSKVLGISLSAIRTKRYRENLSLKDTTS